jgi:prepilin-type N-terminal cleavage/methylation domain-containing protein
MSTVKPLDPDVEPMWTHALVASQPPTEDPFPLPPDEGDRERDNESGFTIAELAVAMMLISILSVLALGIMNNRVEKAKLAACMIDLRSVQSTVWSLSDGVTWPLPKDLWQYMWAGKRPGPYFYLVNTSDANSGHGNDMDICDEENPGKSGDNRDCKDIEFVIVCQHDHRTLAKYVYIEDEGPPTIAGWDKEIAPDPGYDKFIKWQPQQ